MPPASLSVNEKIPDLAEKYSLIYATQEAPSAWAALGQRGILMQAIRYRSVEAEHACVLQALQIITRRIIKACALIAQRVPKNLKSSYTSIHKVRTPTDTHLPAMNDHLKGYHPTLNHLFSVASFVLLWLAPQFLNFFCVSLSFCFNLLLYAFFLATLKVHFTCGPLVFELHNLSRSFLRLGTACFGRCCD